jgi:hypothetical protein
MSLTTAQIELLNNFYKSQPALNVAGLPAANSGVALGDIIHAMEVLISANPPEVSDTAYGAGWNGDTTHAPSKNAIYDKIVAMVVPVAMGASTTDASGDLTVTSMTATGKIVVTPNLTLGADKVFDHIECGVGKVRVFLRTITTDVVAAAGAGLAFNYIVIALA